MTLVYSTDAGRMCPGCRQPVAQCRCHEKAVLPPADGVVRVQRETKGRNGKAVTVIKGLPLDAAALVVWAKGMKAACGSGGTAKDGVVEIQGDHVDKVLARLAQEGRKAKRAGG